MLNLSRTAALLAVLSLVSVAQAAVSVYTQSITAQTSVVITNAQHGLGSPYFGVNVYDSNGALQPTTAYTQTIHATTSELTLGFASAFTGTVKLVGPGNASTTAATDFKVTSPASGKLAICESCTASAYAKRVGATGAYAMHKPITYTASSGTATVRVFIEGNKFIFGLSASDSNSASGSCDAGVHCEIRWNVQSFPTGAIQLGSAVQTSGAFGPTFGSITDLRPSWMQ